MARARRLKNSTSDTAWFNNSPRAVCRYASSQRPASSPNGASRALLPLPMSLTTPWRKLSRGTVKLTSSETRSPAA